MAGFTGPFFPLRAADAVVVAVLRFAAVVVAIAGFFPGTVALVFLTVAVVAVEAVFLAATCVDLAGVFWVEGCVAGLPAHAKDANARTAERVRIFCI